MASITSHYLYPTPYGPVSIAASGRGIMEVVLGNVQWDGRRKPSQLTNRCATQILEYFAGKRRKFEVPLRPQGSEFQKQVWKAIRAIPFGQTRTPLQIAETIGRPTSYRLVGNAVRANPISILIPTHRVVGANGRTLGVDKAARLRSALLAFERSQLSEGRPLA